MPVCKTSGALLLFALWMIWTIVFDSFFFLFFFILCAFSITASTSRIYCLNSFYLCRSSLSFSRAVCLWLWCTPGSDNVLMKKKNNQERERKENSRRKMIYLSSEGVINIIIFVKKTSDVWYTFKHKIMITLSAVWSYEIAARSRARRKKISVIFIHSTQHTYQTSVLWANTQDTLSWTSYNHHWNGI